MFGVYKTRWPERRILMMVWRYLLRFLRYLLTLLIVVVIIVVVICVALYAWYLLPIVAGILFLLIRWYRKARTPIKVVVLGFPNAGKTVFLASMYHQLAIPGQAGCILVIK